MTRVAVIGAGPAGLMAAEVLARAGVRVAVFDRMGAPGRKFLLAGRGGLNLTHSEGVAEEGGMARFLARYREGAGPMEPIIRAFPPQALMNWVEGLGVPIFIGTSGRVFPVGMKASPLLRAWMGRLVGLGVGFHWRQRWEGFSPEGRVVVDGAPLDADAVVLAVGGASWPRMGSDGGWVGWLEGVKPLVASNCGFHVAWSARFREQFAGVPLPRVAMTFEGERAKGAAMVTAAGLEGGAVYALSGPLREAIAREGSAVLTVDLRPELSLAQLQAKLVGARAGLSLANRLKRRLGLGMVEVGLVQEALHAVGGVAGGGAATAAPPRDRQAVGDAAAALAAVVKAVPIRLGGAFPIERAISSAGGVSWGAVDERLMLRARPGVFCAGEMLDWEAPTGGYLLQGCFSTGVAAARGVLSWLGERGKAV